jgi:hypothetical protein
MMKLRKLGDETPFVEIPVDGDAFPLCEVCHMVAWGDEDGVIFFETETGDVHRVEGWVVALSTTGGPSLVVTKCRPVTREEAFFEIARSKAHAPS